ncbi:MAG: YcgN family cysteine cluster protein [Cellvibrionaceae bacterium]
MTPSEWESLCDGCAKCCLHKLEDEDTGKVFYTNVACEYLDLEQCRCNDYEKRNELVPDCIALKPSDVTNFNWLPHTCAYRLVSENKPLPEWHHLISGSNDEIHTQKKSIKGRAISEKDVSEEDMEEHIIRWIR